MKNSITLDDAIKKVRTKMKMNGILLNEYESIVKTLQILFDVEDSETIKKSFQFSFDKEELIHYVRNRILLFMKGTMTSEDIYEISILPNKRISIKANGPFDSDESASCRDAERYIAKYIEIFTGYKVEITL